MRHCLDNGDIDLKFRNIPTYITDIFKRSILNAYFINSKGSGRN